MKEFTMGDLSIELFEIRALCDVAECYAERAANDNPDTPAFDNIFYMLQLIQARVTELEEAVDSANSKKQ